MEIRLRKMPLYQRRGYELEPVSDQDQKKADKLKQYDTYVFKVVHERNYKHHKKFFALLNLAFENQSHYENFEHFRKIMTMKAGYYDAVKDPLGVMVYLPRSISFDNMGQDKFETLYKDVLMALSKELKVEIPQLEEEIEKLTQ